MQVGQLEGLQPPDPDDDPPELELTGAPHEPPLQTWPDAHVLHISPDEPHAVGSVPPWQLLFVSQHPVHEPAHPVLPLVDPPLDPLLEALLDALLPPLLG